MARTKTIRIKEVLTRIFPRDTLEKAALAVGLTQRRRKVKVVAFFWTLVLGFGTGRDRSIAALRRAYQLTAKVSLVPSAFYDRFTPALARWLKHLVEYALAQVSEPTRELRGALASFRDLVVADATVIRLHDLLAGSFAACRTNHTLAALKLHTVMSVNGAGPRKVKITAERVQDGPIFKVGRWVQDRLLLFDLAFFRFQLFACIQAQGGYFISRLKKSADPLIVAVHRRWRGASVELVGKRLSEVLPRLQRDVIDVEIEVAFSRRVYGGIRHKAKERFRLVGVRNAETQEYHLYITNIPPARLKPVEIAQIYAARWVVELFFRELKSIYRADQMPSRKRAVVEALLFSAVITFLASRLLLAELRGRLGAARARRVPDERWAGVFAVVARDILKIMLRPASEAAILTRDVSGYLLHEAVDPNLTRALLRQRTEWCLQFEHRRSVGGGHA
jgi:putative transposase